MKQILAFLLVIGVMAVNVPLPVYAQGDEDTAAMTESDMMLEIQKDIEKRVDKLLSRAEGISGKLD